MKGVEESLREEDEMFDDETFFEKIIERVKNALDQDRSPEFRVRARRQSERTRRLPIKPTTNCHEQEVVEQLQLQRDALLEEITLGTNIGTIERDLDQMLKQKANFAKCRAKKLVSKRRKERQAHDAHR